MVRLPRNEKQIYRLNSGTQMWPFGLTLVMTLTLNFQGQTWNLLYLSQKMTRLPRNEKQTYRLNARPEMWPSGLTLAMTLTLIFQGQIWNLLYLSQKWSDCHETKSKHIKWTAGLKYDQWVWPWQWPWSLDFLKVKRGLFDHTHGVDQGFSWSNFEIALYQNGRADCHWTKVVGLGHKPR